MPSKNMYLTLEHDKNIGNLISHYPFEKLIVRVRHRISEISEIFGKASILQLYKTCTPSRNFSKEFSSKFLRKTYTELPL